MVGEQADSVIRLAFPDVGSPARPALKSVAAVALVSPELWPFVSRVLQLGGSRLCRCRCGIVILRPSVGRERQSPLILVIRSESEA